MNDKHICKRQDLQLHLYNGKDIASIRFVVLGDGIDPTVGATFECEVIEVERRVVER